MVKILLSISLLLMFAGCTAPLKQIQLKEVKPFRIEFEYTSSSNVVTMSADFFETLLEEFMFRRKYANQCIEINNRTIQ